MKLRRREVEELDLLRIDWAWCGTGGRTDLACWTGGAGGTEDDGGSIEAAPEKGIASAEWAAAAARIKTSER